MAAEPVFSGVLLFLQKSVDKIDCAQYNTIKLNTIDCNQKMNIHLVFKNGGQRNGIL